MSDLYKQKQKEYVEQQRNLMQETDEYFNDYADMNLRLQTEAEAQITESGLQDYLRAEKEAGLAEKKIPEQDIPAEVMTQIEAEYEKIHDGEKMSNKARKNAIKEYKKKHKRIDKSRKIYNNYIKYINKTPDLLTKTVRKMPGSKTLKDNERKNSAVAALMGAINGYSAVTMAETLRSLSVPAQEADKKEAALKAFEIEKMFGVILNFDIKKLKYNNSDEFLKNVGEKLIMGGLASEMGHQIDGYRKLVELGKIKDPFPPKLLNEIHARVNLIMTSHTRTQNKLALMTSRLYAMTDEATVKNLGDDINNLIYQNSVILNSKSVTGKQREEANHDKDYYNAVVALSSIDMIQKKTDTFRRGDDPEKLLNEHRKEVEKNYPTDQTMEDVYKVFEERVDADESKEEIKRGNPLLQYVVKKLISGRDMEVNNECCKSTQGKNLDAFDFAKIAEPKQWQSLRENPTLRKHEIQRYYSMLHRGRKIPQDLLDKIESKFEQKFQNGITTDFSEAHESQVKHMQHSQDFKQRHLVNEKDLTYDIPVSRSADAVLYILKDLDDKKQDEKYVAFINLYKYGSSSEELKNLNSGTLEEVEQKKKAIRDDLVTKNTELISYMKSFDLKKLEFTVVAELKNNIVEIQHYVQVMGDVQYFPQALYNVGALTDEEFVDMQARMDLVMEFNMLFQNAVSLNSSILNCLIDGNDLMEVLNAEDITKYKNYKDVPKDKGGMLTLDKKAHENKLRCVELEQYKTAYTSYEKKLSVSFYRPGQNTIAEGLEAAKQNAKSMLQRLRKG